MTESISDVAPDGTFYVVGMSNGSRATIWTIDATLSVVAEDLGDMLYDNGLDVNSAGIVAGWQRDDLNGNLHPVLLMPDNQVINLPGAEAFVQIRINNPDEFGVFQVVGQRARVDHMTPSQWHRSLPQSEWSPAPAPHY